MTFVFALRSRVIVGGGGLTQRSYGQILSPFIADRVNNYLWKLLNTRASDLELRILKLHMGLFMPFLLELRRRISRRRTHA